MKQIFFGIIENQINNELRKDTLAAIDKNPDLKRQDVFVVVSNRLDDPDWKIRMLAVQSMQNMCEKGCVPGIVAVRLSLNWFSSSLKKCLTLPGLKLC